MGVIEGTAGAGDGEAIDLVSASLRASSRDIDTFLTVLAEKLESALPGRVVVERRATRFLGKKTRVESVRCDLGECRYLLERDGGGVAARRATVVRGIVLKSELVRLEDWIDGFSRDLGAEARVSEETQLLFQQLLDG